MQREIPIISEVVAPKLVDAHLLSVCKNRLDAIRLCVQMSGLSNSYICERLHIDAGHFSRIMQGHANFPDTKSHSLMQLCGNAAPMQWEAQHFGFKLSVDARAQRKAELIAELAALEQAA